MCITTLLTIAKTQKQPKCPSTDEWIKKIWYLYTTEYYSAIKKDQILPLATTWIGLEYLHLLKNVRERQILYVLTSL